MTNKTKTRDKIHNQMPTNFAIVGAPIRDAKSGPLDKQQVDIATHGVIKDENIRKLKNISG